MKRHFIVLLLTILFSLPICAQPNGDVLAGYLQRFQFQEALDYIDKQESNKELLIQKAFCFQSLGNYRQSISILEPLSKEYADDIQIKSQLALCYEFVSQRKAALLCYDDLIKLDSTNAYFKIQRADVLYQQGRYREALGQYEQVSELYGFTGMLKRSALCFDKLNILDSAAIYYKRAWDADALDAFSAANLINTKLKQDENGEAVLYSEEYIAIDTTDQQINLLNALAYYRGDFYEEAAKRFEKCYLNGDSSLVVNRSLGMSYYSLGESELAIPYLENAYRMDTANTNVLYCLAVTYSSASEPKKAVPCFKKLLELTIPPRMVLYLYYRGLAIAQESNMEFQESVDNYILALENAPSDNQKMNLYFSIASVYEHFLREYEKAYSYYLLYRESFLAYTQSSKNNKDTDPSEVKILEAKIEYINEIVERLKVRL